MIKGLIKHNVNVIECHETLWNDIEDRVNAVKKGLINPKLWKRFIFTYYQLLKKFRSLPEFDIIVVGYPGHFDIFLAKLLSIFSKKPVVWDVFMSIYLISIERKLDKKNSFTVNFLRLVEFFALRLPDKLIIDTRQYANWFNQTYSIPLKKFCLVPTGADDEVFNANNEIQCSPKDYFKVLYYGTFIPNHGVPYILEAAKCLENEKSLLFQFIGSGPELDLCLDMVNKYSLKNVEFISWMEQEVLINYIHNADIVLGAFGRTPQSIMTVQNKIYESMAMGKLVITGDSHAVRDQFENYREIILCDRDKPENLATVIKELIKNPDNIVVISRNALNKFNRDFSIKKNGLRFVNCLKEELSKP
jgi:glycosyltransferase involved in cell wall biosynthesis